MTYLGSTRAVPGYNVMGVSKASLEASVRYLAADLGGHNIRVNAISAGPVKTLAARGIRGFSKMMRKHEDTTPMKRNVTLQEIANTALFLVSDMSTGITGDVVFVDCGYHMMAV
jgi:enoyl-[acyl-carrier protein] reductase I